MSLKLEKLSVLVAEDILPVRKLLISMLEIIGIGKIYSAGDGRQAFDIFCRAAPDIVMTDWHMPDADGLELLKNIRTSPQSPNKMTPVIFVTGYSAPHRIATARDLGVTEYLVKPFAAEDMIGRILHVVKTPRDFIDSEVYFGPDRRRKTDAGYQGLKRRKADQDSSLSRGMQ